MPFAGPRDAASAGALSNTTMHTDVSAASAPHNSHTASGPLPLSARLGPAASAAAAAPDGASEIVPRPRAAAALAGSEAVAAPEGPAAAAPACVSCVAEPGRPNMLEPRRRLASFFRALEPTKRALWAR